MAPPDDVAGNSGENEGSKKAKKKIKKKGNLCGFKSRFNSKRLAQIGKQISPEKQRIIREGPFGDLLDIRSFKVPHELIEFVAMNTNHVLSEFKHKNKSITFSKLMVKRIFNVPSGDRPVKILKKSDEHDLRNIYKEGNRAPIAHVVKLLTSCSEEDVDMINRTWALLALATVLCPGTGNMVNLEYLASLEDMSLVHEFAWDEHLLARAMEEVGVFQEKKRMQANAEKEFQIASCLPMLAIIYMDHVDIPAGLPNEHAIDYSVPRIRFVCQKDFEWLDKVDKNKLTLIQPFYGKHTHIRSLCNTPYAAQLVGQEVGAEAASGQGGGAEAPSGQGISGQGSQVQGAENQAKNSQSNEAQQNVDAEPHLSSSLNEWLQQSFPSMQDLRVPTQFQMLYDKHKGIFAAEVDDVVGKFGQCLKGLQCSRMAALLRDVGDAVTATSEPNFSFEAPIMDECRGKENDAKAANDGIGAQAQAEGTTPSINKDEVTGLKQQVATEAAETREQQIVSFEMEGNVSPHSPPLFYDAPRSATAGIWDDEPSCELFPKGSEDYEMMHCTDEPITKKSTVSPIFENIPVFPVPDDDDSPTPNMVATEEHFVEASSGPSTHDKNTRKKRMAKVPAVKNTKAKKQKVDAAAAMYEKYVKHGKPLRRSHANEQVTPFIKMGGFYIGYKKFLVCFKPRGDMNDEVMSLCIEMNNMTSRAASGTNRKKYMFSVHAGMLLKQDPTTFQPAKLIPELERAVTKFKANKYDLLFFTIVHDKHWIIVCANLLYKQWNVFDSIHSKGKQSPLKKQANNLITNFAALAQEYSQFNVDVGSFARVDLEDYPKQDNLCDCGFFGLKYVENFDGKSMKEFNQEDVARYRMDVVHNLCTHPMNNAPMERAFNEELAA
ncbi:hypothetical protein VPH35_068461 [Triticum aestivum]|uniref:Ubiquitin-like protease family profile domain-containing protein n=2 Tax=Triticum aestivum TaxID=4565 RepID=A0A3B6HZ11_WHEAT